MVGGECDDRQNDADRAGRRKSRGRHGASRHVTVATGSAAGRDRQRCAAGKREKCQHARHGELGEEGREDGVQPASAAAGHHTWEVALARTPPPLPPPPSPKGRPSLPVRWPGTIAATTTSHGHPDLGSTSAHPPPPTPLCPPSSHRPPRRPCQPPRAHPHRRPPLLRSRQRARQRRTSVRRDTRVWRGTRGWRGAGRRRGSRR